MRVRGEAEESAEKGKNLAKGVLNPVDEFIRDRERTTRRPRRLASVHRQATKMVVSTPRERVSSTRKILTRTVSSRNKESAGRERLLHSVRTKRGYRSFVSVCWIVADDILSRVYSFLENNVSRVLIP